MMVRVIQMVFGLVSRTIFVVVVHGMCFRIIVNFLVLVVRRFNLQIFFAFQNSVPGLSDLVINIRFGFES